MSAARAAVRPRAAARRARASALASRWCRWPGSGAARRGDAPALRLQAFALLVLFLSFDLVLLGAFTRLSDSGLGCPDWPGCYGHASPLGASAHIAAAEAAVPTGAGDRTKAWIEMVHRYAATAIGVLVVVLAALALVARRGAPVGRIGARWALVRRCSGSASRARSARSP